MSKELKIHIGIFGRRNTGKSTLINALTGQQISIVSTTPGTTTDPVKKSIEIPGIGSVILIDTAGIDDDGEVGNKRVSSTINIINSVDVAILVIADNKFDKEELALIKTFRDNNISFITIHNKEDISAATVQTIKEIEKQQPVAILRHHQNCNTNKIVDTIKKAISTQPISTTKLLPKLVLPGSTIVLVVPIDTSAPAGRLILPQVQTIRAAIDKDAICIVLKPSQLKNYLNNSNIKPALVITDSQIFDEVSAITPLEIPLTSFSVMQAHFKGDFEAYKQGTPHIDKLKDGDKILILESCTHHVSCGDIGREKLPKMISKYTGLTLYYTVVAGLDEIPEPISQFAMAIQCGGCMITRRQLNNRLHQLIINRVPISNYGMTIAYINNIFKRAIKPFE